ncbi:hypothetical protein [Micromonospora sp. CPCC 205556]|uniref:hypothetical protein n=1 Tax=Micromonospora sp. CPCC 205556 TaxID=3122398 RepID=UPI002FF33860
MNKLLTRCRLKGEVDHMSRQGALSPAAKLTVAALVVAASGVVVQMVAGVGFPTIPPVFFILLGPAALALVGRWRWAPVPAVLAGLFLTVGLFLSGESARLFDTGQQGGVGGSAGLWLQTTAVAVAGVAAAVTTIQNYRAARTDGGNRLRSSR